MDITNAWIGKIGFALVTGLIASCSPSPPATAPTPQAVSSVVSPSLPTATIAEIQRQPVFVRLLQALQETPAQEGMPLQIGETIRTQGQALAQVDLSNGLAFRIGGDAVLTLQPDNRLNLNSGNMITWVQPGRKVPAEIVTPAGVAGIRGTTVYVEIPKDPKQGILFFAWEGSVAVRPPGQTEEIMLKTADEVRISPDDRDMKVVQQRVRRMPTEMWRQKRQTDRLLHGFRKPMPTLPIIQRIKPGQISLDATVTQQLSNPKTLSELERSEEKRSGAKLKTKQNSEKSKSSTRSDSESSDRRERKSKPAAVEASDKQSRKATVNQSKRSQPAKRVQKEGDDRNEAKRSNRNERTRPKRERDGDDRDEARRSNRNERTRPKRERDEDD